MKHPVVKVVRATQGLLSVAVLSCSPSIAPIELEGGIEARFGLPDGTSEEVLAGPWAAAVSTSGRFVSIADWSPPFIRVWDRRTGKVSVFGNRGEGPGELNARPGAIAFLTDTTFLVLAAGRLEEFHVSRGWMQGKRMSTLDLSLSSATTGCNGRVFGYGVAAASSAVRRDSTAWLHEILAESQAARPVFWLANPATEMSAGGLYGLDGSEEGVLMWHRGSQPGSGYWIPCVGPGRRFAGSDMSPPGEVAGSGGTNVAFELPDTMFSGAVVGGDVLYWAVQWSDEHGQRTTIRSERLSACRTVTVAGSWTLRDGHARMLVISTLEPHPQVVLVNRAWIDRASHAASC